jgi:Spy/CpxP family protein refolding chaperone
MVKQNKWIAVLVLGVLAVIGISSLAFAQRIWRSCNSWTNRDMPLEYRLNQEQAQEMEKIRAEFHEKVLPLEQQLATKRVEMDAVWVRSDGNPTQTQELRREIRDLESKLEDIHFEASDAAAKHLSPEQRSLYGDAVCVWAASGWSCPWDDRRYGNRTMRSRWGAGWQRWRGNWMSGQRCCW